MTALVFATGNRGKRAEMALLLPELFVQGLEDFPGVTLPPETGTTFAENAALKAEFVARVLDRPVLADDSGLVVDALGGRPGVHSARYAEGSDQARWQKLLAELAPVPEGARGARFVCALAFVEPGRAAVVREGIVEGRIALGPRGERGFGYDPVFLVEDGARTMAELSADEKNRCSHRARAVAALRPLIAERLGLAG